MYSADLYQHTLPALYPNIRHCTPYFCTPHPYIYSSIQLLEDAMQSIHSSVPSTQLRSTLFHPLALQHSGRISQISSIRRVHALRYPHCIERSFNLNETNPHKTNLVHTYKSQSQSHPLIQHPPQPPSLTKMQPVNRAKSSELSRTDAVREWSVDGLWEVEESERLGVEEDARRELNVAVGTGRWDMGNVRFWVSGGYGSGLRGRWCCAVDQGRGV